MGFKIGWLTWEQRKLGDVTDIKTGSRNHQDSVENGKYPFFVRSEKIERLDEYDFDTKAILIPGDGRIGEIFHYYDGKFALHQRVYKVDNFNGIDALFLLSLFRYSFRRHALRLNAQGTVPSLRLPMFTKWEILLPKLEEQEKIGQLFQSLDRTITLHEEKQRQLEQLKKALLQKMFADKKHPKPELRFKSFHDNWIDHKAGDFMIERNQKATIDDDFPLKAFIANKGVADKGERYDRSAITNDASNKMYKRTLFNDFIYSSNNLETGSIGLNKYGNASISPVYSIFYFKNKESADFFGRILVRKEFINSMIRYRQGVVYGQWRIKEKDFLNISISVPSLEEQEKIGSLLDKLDETINVNSKLLNQLKVLKKSLLQNMFI